MRGAGETARAIILGETARQENAKAMMRVIELLRDKGYEIRASTDPPEDLARRHFSDLAAVFAFLRQHLWLGALDEQEISSLAQGIASGALIVVELRPAFATRMGSWIPTRAKPRDPPAVPVVPPAVEEKSWIEFILEDDRGNPIGGQLADIRLADGQRISMASDRNGVIRLPSIAAGDCQISFPTKGADPPP